MWPSLGVGYFKVRPFFPVGNEIKTEPKSVAGCSYSCAL